MGSSEYYDVYAMRMNFNVPPLDTDAANIASAQGSTFYNREASS